QRRHPFSAPMPLHVLLALLVHFLDFLLRLAGRDSELRNGVLNQRGGGCVTEDMEPVGARREQALGPAPDENRRSLLHRLLDDRCGGRYDLFVWRRRRSLRERGHGFGSAEGERAADALDERRSSLFTGGDLGH